jgi:hypothetical protein
LAEGYHRLFQSAGLKSIRLVGYDFKSAPQWKKSAQSGMNAVVEAITTFSALLIKPVEMPPSTTIEKATIEHQSLEKKAEHDEAATSEAKKFTVTINSLTQVVVNGTGIREKKPRMALLGLAVLSQGQPPGSLSFTTSNLIDLIHVTPPGTSPSQIWDQYKKELTKKLTSLIIEGDAGQYTIQGLDFKLNPNVDIKKLLQNNKAGRRLPN